MRNDAGRVSVAAICMMGLLTVFLAQNKVFTALYRLGIWQQYTAADVERGLKRSSPDVSVQCEPGQGGWDFTCDYLERRYDGRFIRGQFGVMSTYYGPVAYCAQLPAEAPSAFRLKPRGCPK